MYANIYQERNGHKCIGKHLNIPKRVTIIKRQGLENKIQAIHSLVSRIRGKEHFFIMSQLLRKQIGKKYEKWNGI